MIQNRYVQLSFRILFFAAFLVGTLISFGVFSGSYSSNWYVYYTNLSNYFCMLVILAEIIATSIKLSHNQKTGYGDVHPAVKFAALIDIAVTFFVFNILLVDASSNLFTHNYWTSLTNIFFHFSCPILFFLDWLLFTKHPSTKWHYPFYVLIFPLIYVAFILVRGNILSHFPQSTDLIYPYFFLDVNGIGLGKVFMWVGILIAAFLALSYVIFFVENLKRLIGRSKTKK